jgi:hypothetical protein
VEAILPKEINPDIKPVITNKVKKTKNIPREELYIQVDNDITLNLNT